MPLAMRSILSTAVLLLAGSAAAQTLTPTPTSTSSVARRTTSAPTTTSSPTFTAVSDCHPHKTVLWCMVGEEEYQVSGPTATEEFQSQYTDCHSHSSGVYCVDNRGEDVKILVNGAGEESPSTEEESHSAGDSHGHEEEPASGSASEPGNSGQHCHEHAGIPHCVGGSSGPVCEAPDRNYNIGLRVGLLFVILVTSGIGVFTPVLTRKFNLVGADNIIFVVLKQFGTGIVISTAFVHLFTHAELMFSNECLGRLEYEGTTAAIFMAGLFLSFLVDYLGARFVQWRQGKQSSNNTEVAAVAGDNKAGEVASTPSSDQGSDHGHAGHAHGPMRIATPMEQKINVMNLEAGIIFHSILIGITLVVASDGFFITLFIVILFHQMFEGIALGTCIADLPKAAAGTLQKLIMAGTFALITPIGMAIGIGVLDHFNGSDPSTLVAIGTLDALSAGILAWVGLVEMLARDWMSGKLMNAGLIRTLSAMSALVAGLILMSVLGKWA